MISQMEKSTTLGWTEGDYCDWYGGLEREIKVSPLIATRMTGGIELAKYSFTVFVNGVFSSAPSRWIGE